MAFDRANIYVRSSEGEFWQGEILSNLAEYQWVGPDSEANLVNHPLAMILSADCDLTQDHIARTADTIAPDKFVPNILLCDVLTSAELRGNHGLNSKLWPDVTKNKNERYQYLAEVPQDKDLEGAGFAALGMDFKQFFCISMSHLLRQLEVEAKRRCRLESPFAQHLAQRFFSFHARIGLPVDHA